MELCNILWLFIQAFNVKKRPVKPCFIIKQKLKVQLKDLTKFEDLEKGIGNITATQIIKIKALSVVKISFETKNYKQKC